MQARQESFAMSPVPSSAYARNDGKRTSRPELVTAAYRYWLDGYDHLNLPAATSSVDDET
jgi:hypothetical protein